MLPFSLLQWQYVVIALFVGFIIVIMLYFAFQSREYSGGRKKKDEIHEFPEGITEGKKPIPLFLILIYVFIAVWCISYVIMISIKGFKF